MRDKLKYRSKVTAAEVKQLTAYEQHKEEIDALTGKKDLDFPFKDARVNEYEIRMILEDGSYLFLPIIATDGQGYRHDKEKGYGAIHRPETREEKKARQDEEKRKAEQAKRKVKAEKDKEKEKEAKKAKTEKNSEEKKPTKKSK